MKKLFVLIIFLLLSIGSFGNEIKFKFKKFDEWIYITVKNLNFYSWRRIGEYTEFYYPAYSKKMIEREIEQIKEAFKANEKLLYGDFIILECEVKHYIKEYYNLLIKSKFIEI